MSDAKAPVAPMPGETSPIDSIREIVDERKRTPEASRQPGDRTQLVTLFLKQPGDILEIESALRPMDLQGVLGQAYRMIRQHNAKERRIIVPGAAA